MTTQLAKTTGHVSTIHLNITSPVPFKEQSIEFKKLALFVGQNGSGKTMILIFTWAITTIAQMVVMVKLPVDLLIQHAQYIFDNCFTDQNIDGEIHMDFESGCTLGFKFEKGKVIDIAVTGFEEINTPTRATFMSAEMRTFDSISKYCGMRKMVKSLSPGIPRENLVGEMCKTYRIFDVMYIEGLIERMPCLIHPDIAKTLKDNFEFKQEISGFGFDEEKADFYTTIKSSPNKYLSTYSKGEQSILNMMIANMPQT